MTTELEKISFTLTKQEIKDLNKYRKQFPDEDLFSFKLTPTGVGITVEVKPKELDEPWENISDFASW